MSTLMPSKDPSAEEPYFIVWCDESNLNDGSASDRGELQSATIDTATWTVSPALPVTLEIASSNEAAVTINGVTYLVDTVATVWVKGGTANKNYDLNCQILTVEAAPRTLEKTITIPVRAH